uniref:Uncharacterized protein n=1 Tax=Octopus bimaculoides TaxID=37653 RepID=A0A0L8G5Z5_OCTBM
MEEEDRRESKVVGRAERWREREREIVRVRNKRGGGRKTIEIRSDRVREEKRKSWDKRGGGRKRERSGESQR